MGPGTAAEMMTEKPETGAEDGANDAPDAAEDQAASTPPEPEPAASPEAARAAESPGGAPAGAPAAAPSGRPDNGRAQEREEIRRLRVALKQATPVEGRIIGWNNGGFHVVVDGITAFCPRSEMELGAPREASTYLDGTYDFQVLKIQKNGRRVVVSRAAPLRAARSRQRSELRGRIEPQAVLEGSVASISDFGAFVDLGGVQGLVHISEISRQRLDHPSQALEVGQKVQVKVLKVEQEGKRISLSMRALEPDPWRDIQQRYPAGSMARGRVEKTTSFGAFVELEPGLTGLLPSSQMSIPPDSSAARVYPPGKEIAVQILDVDSRRQRISLGLEGSGVEGTRGDFQAYRKQHSSGGGGDGFNALADAFKRLRRSPD